MHHRRDAKQDDEDDGGRLGRRIVVKVHVVGSTNSHFDIHLDRRASENWLLEVVDGASGLVRFVDDIRWTIEAGKTSYIGPRIVSEKNNRGIMAIMLEAFRRALCN